MYITLCCKALGSIAGNYLSSCLFRYVGPLLDIQMVHLEYQNHLIQINVQPRTQLRNLFVVTLIQLLPYELEGLYFG
jgi:hypothetical protein